jgi:hypothetical protein
MSQDNAGLHRAHTQLRRVEATPQPRQQITDLLDRMTPRWDDIVAQARLGTRQQDLHAVEELAQRFADDLLVVFRGSGARRPSAAPLKVSDDGRSAWF